MAKSYTTFVALLFCFLITYTAILYPKSTALQNELFDHSLGLSSSFESHSSGYASDRGSALHPQAPPIFEEQVITLLHQYYG
nr:hypothetical protein Iba_chr02aCG15120 [Ipomoea batatas]